MTALSEVRSAYASGEEIRISGLGPDVAVALVRTARGEAFPGQLTGGEAVVTDVPVGTHSLELCSGDGQLLGEELLSVRDSPGDDPILGFATSFDTGTVPQSLRWLEQLRCTVVQIYDWMESYSAPLGAPGVYKDRLGRQIDRGALEQLVAGVKHFGAVAQAYAPILAADPGTFADLRLYRNDGVKQTLGDLLDIMDPGDAAWQRYWLAQYGNAADTLGFNGFHLDTYGYPRVPVTTGGSAISIDDGFADFVSAVRAARPADVLSFNQVNGVPSGFQQPAAPSFRYAEVWPPNDRWRHLEALMARSAGLRPRHGDTLAIYPPVWDGDRDGALRTVVLTEAVATMLGIGALIWGDNHGALRHPYYVDHEQLRPEEAQAALGWHRFGLRCRDLFKRGVDTSWYELDDENAAVTVAAAVPVTPEPVGGGLFARVLHAERSIVVGLLDLSGSAQGSWREVTAPGQCTAARISVLLPEPDSWRAHAAVLGHDDGRFTAVSIRTEPHREGLAATCEVPIVSGWSVLRLQKEGD